MPPDGQPPGPPAPPPGPPEYKVYKSRRGLLDRARAQGIGNPLDRLRRRRRPDEQPPGLGKPPRKVTVGRVLKWVAIATGSWILLSAILFFISAAVQEGVSERTEEALSPGGSLLTGSTVLVIGSDARPKDTKEPLPGDFGERADSILLLRVGAGSVRRLSILRDTYVETDEYTGKINGAFAGGGGGARLIEVLEDYLGNDLKINHVVQVDFENFPEFIDSLGGVDVTVKQRCVKPAERFGGFRIRELKFDRGEHHLDGRTALAFARIRKNACNPREDDRQRAARQQLVLSGIRDQALSPSTFFRLPWVAWNAPKTVESDMNGPGLSTLFFDLASGGSGKTRVLRFDGLGPAGSVTVSEERKQREVERLLGED